MTVAANLRSDSLRTRHQILRSASDLCREQGFERVRMVDIAERVGCSRATIYNHFANRDLLLEALCTEYLKGYVLIVGQIQEWAGPEHTIFEVLRETVAAELRWRAAHAELRGALDSAKRMRRDFYMREDALIDRAMVRWFSSIYAASEELGLLRDNCDLTLATPVVYAMSNHVVGEFPVQTPPAEIARIADQVARLQWHALYRLEPEEAPEFGGLSLAVSS